VLETMRQVVARIRAGEGPILIEAMTERIVGHYIGDAQQYRTPADHERIQADEPIARARRALRAAGVTDHEIDAVVDRAHAEIDRASAAALAAPPSDTSTVFEHLYG